MLSPGETVNSALFSHLNTKNFKKMMEPTPRSCTLTFNLKECCYRAI